MATTRETRSISFPPEILKEIDGYAEKWFTSRSEAIVRIFQEWKRPTKVPIGQPITIHPDGRVEYSQYTPEIELLEAA